MLIMSLEINIIGGGLGLIFIVIGLMRVFARVKAKRKFQLSNLSDQKE